MPDFCEHGTTSSGRIKFGEFLRLAPQGGLLHADPLVGTNSHINYATALRDTSSIFWSTAKDMICARNACVAHSHDCVTNNELLSSGKHSHSTLSLHDIRNT